MGMVGVQALLSIGSRHLDVNGHSIGTEERVFCRVALKALLGERVVAPDPTN
jgi:hypothetical protein